MFQPDITVSEHARKKIIDFSSNIQNVPNSVMFS